ncbi:MAG: lysophospholipid acyltransferase family protein, partial [Bacteroidota bacterium]
RRCRVTNPELLAPYAAQGKSVLFYGSHYANWEIAALSFSSQLQPHVTMGIYSPLKNQTLDRLIHGNRKRFGTLLVSRRAVDEYFDAPPPLSADFFIADQSPSNAKWQKLHWTTFLGKTTGFLVGPERYANWYDRPVFYMRLRRVKRGHFEASLVPVCEDPSKAQPGEITEACVRILENELNRAPAYWLWTHRRWKRGVPSEIPPLLADKPYLAGEYERKRSQKAIAKP